jgi:hypothetical protein
LGLDDDVSEYDQLHPRDGDESDTFHNARRKNVLSASAKRLLTSRNGEVKILISMLYLAMRNGKRSGRRTYFLIKDGFNLVAE